MFVAFSKIYEGYLKVLAICVSLGNVFLCSLNRPSNAVKLFPHAFFREKMQDSLHQLDGLKSMKFVGLEQNVRYQMGNFDSNTEKLGG